MGQHPAGTEQFANELYAEEHVRNFRREREQDQMRLGDFFPQVPPSRPSRRKRSFLSPRQGEVLQALADQIARDLLSCMEGNPPLRSPETLARHALEMTGLRSFGVPRTLALLPGACLSLWEGDRLRQLGVVVPTPLTSMGAVLAAIGHALGWPKALIPMPGEDIMQVGLMTEGKSEFKRKRFNTGQPAFDALIRRGEALRVREKRDEALQVLDQAIQLNEHDPWGYYFKALVYFEMPNINAREEAIKNLRLADELGGNSPFKPEIPPQELIEVLKRINEFDLFLQENKMDK